VQGVTNPLPASGGADPDSVAETKENAPLAVMALDRVVSVEDYQDFARAWAGIGKASSTLLSDGTQEFVHLTIGGTTAQPIETSSALYANLIASLAANGDPHVPLRVAPCDVSLIVLIAGIHIGSQYQWTNVSAAARDALLSGYSYENRSLGQDVVLSDVVATIQAVVGVDYAVVTGLTTVAFSDPASTVKALTELTTTLNKTPLARIPIPLADVGPPGHTVHPAQVAILSPDIPDSLVLTQIVP
jgi:predicted phage baseplate assembly protein